MLAIAPMLDPELRTVHAYAVVANDRLANTRVSTRAMAREARRTVRITLTIPRRAGRAKVDGRGASEIQENRSIARLIGPAAVTCPCLDGRAGHGAVRAEDAAVSCQRLEPRCAIRTFMKVRTRVGRHLQWFDVTAFRARQYGCQLHGCHPGKICCPASVRPSRP